MNLPARLRDATEADLPAIVEIYNATIPSRMATADTVPVTVESRLPWFRAHNAQTRPLWVAEIPIEQSRSGRPDRLVLESGPGTKAVETPASTIVAWLSLNTFLNGRPAYNGTAEVSIYVSEKYQRHGIGHWLLSEAIARAPQCGITTLVGNIWAHNKASIHLAESFGFERWGYLPRVAIMDGIDRDLAILGKRLKD